MTGSVLAPDRVTVNVASVVPVLPSVTLTSPTEIAGVTTIGAVGPVGVTETSSLSALASFRYVPGSSATVTPKWSVSVPPAGSVNGPVHRSRCPVTVGLAVVAPVVEPGVYVKPSGRSSTSASISNASVCGLAIVIV